MTCRENIEFKINKQKQKQNKKKQEYASISKSLYQFVEKKCLIKIIKFMTCQILQDKTEIVKLVNKV